MSGSEDDRAGDPLVIRRLEFVGGMAQAGGWRPEATLPEVAFAGRSNVGKSSLINTLLRRKKMARVSNTPGRTQEINFFRVNDQFMLVDLPGYGYARVSKTARASWKPLIEGYLRTSPQLRGIVQLLDARHDPTKDDLAMLDFLADVGVPAILVATKIDKLAARELPARMAELAKVAGVAPEDLLPFSATSGAGRHELAEAMMALLEQPAFRAEDAPGEGAGE